ncbi:multicopper oxidase [Peniophora sp. CONT]|nr:multicopper oxidase [Peniophora sp. CONT]
MRATYSLLLVSSGLRALAVSASIIKSLVIGSTNTTYPDTDSTRTAVAINGQFPGPVITGNVGDTFVINVFDDVPDDNLRLASTVVSLGTHLHWHGLFQTGTNEMDGVDRRSPSTTRTASSNPFTYRFIGNRAGTFWYYSENGTQSCDGIRGPAVVYDPNDPHRSLYDVDDETTIITLATWYQLNSPESPQSGSFNPTLINGKGRDSVAFGENLANELSVVSVEAGTRYRMRLISMSCDPYSMYTLYVHQMTIIEVEGTNVEPLVVDQIQISPGQRYSFVLNANQPVDNYWIRAFPGSTGTNTLPQASEHGLSQAILRYSGASLADPITTTTSPTLPLLETNLHPLKPTPVPGVLAVGGADSTLTLNLTSGEMVDFSANNVPYTALDVPILRRNRSDVTAAQELTSRGGAHEPRSNSVIDLVVPGASLAGQSVHLHGHNFWVIRSAGNSSYNWDNPIVRDVVSVGNDAMDNVTIRFETNRLLLDTGCQVDLNVDTGSDVVMAKSPAKLASDVNVKKCALILNVHLVVHHTSGP